MLDKWREWRSVRRAFRKGISQIEAYYKPQFEAERKAGNKPNLDLHLEYRHEIESRETRLSQYESDRLKRQAQRYGIEIPQTMSWWKETKWRDSDGEEYDLPPEEVRYYLTDIGKVNVRKLIRDERRNNVEWWLTKVILPILQTLIPILSLLVALASVSKK